MPAHGIGVAGVFFLQLFLRERILVVHLDPTLQEGIGQLNLHVLDEVHNETAAENMLRVAVELTRQLLGHLFAEVLFSSNHVLAEDLDPQALVVLSGGEALDFFDFKTELTLQVVDLFVGDAEHLSEVLVSVRNLMRVDIEGVSDLRSGQGFAGFSFVEVLERDVGIAFDAAFEGFAGIIQLSEMADEQVRIRGEFLFADASVATGMVAHGSFDGLFVHLDDVAGELGAASEAQVDFWSETNFVGEGEVFRLFPIAGSLCAGLGNGVAEYVNLFLGDVGAQFF